MWVIISVPGSQLASMTCSLGAGGSCCHLRGGAVRAGNRTTVEVSALANGAAEMQP